MSTLYPSFYAIYGSNTLPDLRDLYLRYADNV